MGCEGDSPVQAPSPELLHCLNQDLRRFMCATVMMLSIRSRMWRFGVATGNGFRYSPTSNSCAFMCRDDCVVLRQIVLQHPVGCHQNMLPSLASVSISRLCGGGLSCWLLAHHSRSCGRLLFVSTSRCFSRL